MAVLRGYGLDVVKPYAGPAVPRASEEPKASAPLKYEVRRLQKGEVVPTPYGSVLVGMNAVVVTCGQVTIPMPAFVAEALFGYKQGG